MHDEAPRLVLNFKALYQGLDVVKNCFVSLLAPFGSPAEAERRTAVRALLPYLGRDYIEFNEKIKGENVSITKSLGAAMRSKQSP